MGAHLKNCSSRSTLRRTIGRILLDCTASSRSASIPGARCRENWVIHANPRPWRGRTYSGFRRNNCRGSAELRRLCSRKADLHHFECAGGLPSHQPYERLHRGARHRLVRSTRRSRSMWPRRPSTLVPASGERSTRATRPTCRRGATSTSGCAKTSSLIFMSPRQLADGGSALVRTSNV